MCFLSLLVLFASKTSNTVKYNSIMMKLALRSPWDWNVKASFLPLSINHKVIILVLIILKDTGFNTFKLVFLVSLSLVNIYNLSYFFSRANASVILKQIKTDSTIPSAADCTVESSERSAVLTGTKKTLVYVHGWNGKAFKTIGYLTVSGGATDPCFPMQYRVYIPRKYFNFKHTWVVYRE